MFFRGNNGAKKRCDFKEINELRAEINKMFLWKQM